MVSNAFLFSRQSHVQEAQLHTWTAGHIRASRQGSFDGFCGAGFEVLQGIHVLSRKKYPHGPMWTKMEFIRGWVVSVWLINWYKRIQRKRFKSVSVAYPFLGKNHSSTNLHQSPLGGELKTTWLDPRCRNRVAVGHHDPIKTPFLPQERLQHALVAAGRHTVHLSGRNSTESMGNEG